MVVSEPTLCWDCARAIGGCSWVDDKKPVEGWTATQTQKKSTLITYESYCVHDCPMFKRDAYANGTKRYRQELEDFCLTDRQN